MLKMIESDNREVELALMQLTRQARLRGIFFNV